MKNIDKYKEKIFQLIDRGDSLPCAIANVAGISGTIRCQIKCTKRQKNLLSGCIQSNQT